MNEMNSVVRLPLWKSCLEQMQIGGVEYGKVYAAEFFEEHLRTKRDTMQFGLAVSEIRKCLEEQGFYLSGRGGKGDQWVILEPSSNVDVCQCYSRAATDALKRGVILGTNTRLDTLSIEQRRRHENVLEKMAVKLALIRSSQKVYKAIQKHEPKLLAQ